MFTKELYKITCTRNGETSDIGTYSEPDTSYHLMFIPMDDDFWARCAAEKETKQ